MTIHAHTTCPVHADFDPLSSTFLADPFAVLASLPRETPVFYAPSMVSLDPPAHTRLRAPTVRAFTPQRVAQMESRIRATVDQLLDAIDPSAPFDLVATLTFPLPTTIIFSFVGIPERDWPQLKEWCGHRASLAWGRPTPTEHFAGHETTNYLIGNVVRRLLGEPARWASWRRSSRSKP